MKVLLLGLFLSIQVFSQTDTLSINNYLITLNAGDLSVTNEQGQNVFMHSFINPSAYPADLDEDGADELVLVDSATNGNYLNYIFYICSALDSFYIADSILSGAMEPYYTLSEELGETIIVTGNYHFRIYDSGNDGYLPINCWKYDSGSLYPLIDELYDIYLSENEGLIGIMDSWYEMNARDCSNSVQIKGAIAAVYSNYINAGEQALASQFIKNYYLCEDLERFRGELDTLLTKEE